MGYLVEVIQCLVKVSQHASGRFISDLDGGLQDALRDDVACPVSRWLSGHVHPVILMAALAVLLQLFVQPRQPLGHQVNVLRQREQQRYKNFKY